MLLAAGAGLVLMGAVALAAGQRWGVWASLGGPGLLVLVVLGVNVPALLTAYRAAEERRMMAWDLDRQAIANPAGVVERIALAIRPRRRG